MTAQEFLKKSLKEWCTRFEGIKVRYAYDAVTEYHIVEVEPETVRRGNAEYKQAEMELWLSFMEFYPEENLLITSPSDANDMSNELYNSERYRVIVSDTTVLPITTTFNTYVCKRNYSFTCPSLIETEGCYSGIRDYAFAA